MPRLFRRFLFWVVLPLCLFVSLKMSFFPKTIENPLIKVRINYGAFSSRKIVGKLNLPSGQRYSSYTVGVIDADGWNMTELDKSGKFEAQYTRFPKGFVVMGNSKTYEIERRLCSFFGLELEIFLK